jgi:hypothetical protein
MTSQNWGHVADLLQRIADDRAVAWGVFGPSGDSVSSESDERCADGWCGGFVRNLPELANPPQSTRPWVLARLLACEAVARILHEKNAACPDLPLRELAGQLLIVEWHTDLKKRWPELARKLDGSQN